MNEAKTSTAERTRIVRPVTRGEVIAWALCDWANSAYSTLSITLLVFYLQDIVLPDRSPPVIGSIGVAAGAAPRDEILQVLGITITGTRVWGWGLGISMLCAAWLSPILGAMADARASKWKWLIGTSLPGAAFATALALVPASQPIPICILFFLTSLCFELSFGFYNGFLPELADDESMNRISGFGFAAGYLGGGVALAVALAVAFLGPKIGLNTAEERLRAGLVVMGLWWGIFTLPAAFMLRDRALPRNTHLGFGHTAMTALREVWHTLNNVRAYSVLSLFLLGFLVYNEGIQTVMSQASVFAKRPPLSMDSNELILVVLMIQFVAFPAALGVGWISDRIGSKTTLLVCLAIWCGLLVAGYFVQTKQQFWIMAVVLSLVMGGTQSVSRAIMGAMTPAAKTAEFFGFFNLSCRATSMVGPILFTEVLERTGKANIAILSLLGFIVCGMVIITLVNLPRGMQQAKAG
jgi:UMF1 family MFS transporter